MNEFLSATVNESLVFESLKVSCILQVLENSIWIDTPHFKGTG